MQTYTHYKDSGIDWIGPIPEHWNEIKIKNLFTEPTSKFIDGDWIESKDINSSEIYYFTTGNIQELKFKETEKSFISIETFKKLNCTEVLDGDILVSRLNVPLGRCCIFTGYDKKSIVSVDVVIFRPDEFYNRKYLVYVMNSPLYFSNTENIARGAIMKRISRTILGNIKIPIPPIQEQESIANFLDEKTAKIDALVQTKVQQIEKLKELRQAKIHQAVTKGLDANVPTKDSGIEWIGEIPAHWEVRRFKFLCNISTGGRNTEDKVDGGLYPFYVRSQTEERINTYSFNGEAILTAGDGAGVGKVYHYVNGKFDFHQRVYKFSDFKKVNGKLLFHYLSSEFYNVAILGTAKSTVDSLRLPIIQDFMVSFPNNLNEQIQIIQFIDEVTGKIDQAIAQKQEQITKLKEYKQSLINNVVTGKIKVC